MWRRRLLVAGGFLLLLGVTVYLVDRGRSAGRLARVIKELDASDPGWTWDDIEAAQHELPAAENSAPRLLAVVDALPTDWPYLDALNATKDVEPNRLLTGPQRKTLDDVLAVPPVPALRLQARGLSKFPRGRFDIHRFGVQLTSEAWKVQIAASLLSLDARALSLDGRHADAMEAATACLFASRVVEDEPFSFVQHNRFIGVDESLSMAERAMALGDVPDAALAAYQEALRHDAAHAGLVAVMRGERAFLHRALRLHAAGRGTLRNILHDSSWDSWGLGWTNSTVSRWTARREHALVLETLTEVLAAAKLPLKDQFAAEVDIARHLHPSSGSVLLRECLPKLLQLLANARRMRCQATAMRALIAVERYQRKHGKWPVTLDDTVLAFLDEVPEDPIDGRPIRYANWAEGVVVYSIGHNRMDDGGAVGGIPEWKPFGTPEKDFGYRLWNPDKRCSAPHP